MFVYDARDPEEFEQAYGTKGDWADFFSSSPGYVGSELLRDIEQPGRYVVIDRWESEEAYNAFVVERGAEYMRRVDETGYLYDRELRFGTFANIWDE